MIQVTVYELTFLTETLEANSSFSVFIISIANRIFLEKYWALSIVTYFFYHSENNAALYARFTQMASFTVNSTK